MTRANYLSTIPLSTFTVKRFLKWPCFSSSFNIHFNLKVLNSEVVLGGILIKWRENKPKRHICYLFELCHRQPVHPPQFLFGQLGHVPFGVLSNRKWTGVRQEYHQETTISGSGLQFTSSLSSLSLLSSSNPFFLNERISGFSGFSGSFSFSFFTSSVSCDRKPMSATSIKIWELFSVFKISV